jgi:hypothetical protein
MSATEGILSGPAGVVLIVRLAFGIPTLSALVCKVYLQEPIGVIMFETATTG